MPLFASLLDEHILPPAAALGLLAFAAVWGVVISRWRRRRPAIPFQPRRPVPWRFVDVSLLLIAYFIAPAIFVPAARNWLDAPPSAHAEVAAETELNVEHPLARVLQNRSNRWAILMCVVLAVAVTPIAEELLFRLLIQGWLESLERRLRRRFRVLRRIVAGAGPVALVTLMFAALHFRLPGPRAEITDVIALLSGIFASNLLIIAVTVCWLKFVVGATAADLGFVPARLASDVKLGLLAFLAVTPPVYGAAIAAKQLLPAGAIVDPIPLLLLAAALGILYYRTHRIVPAIVLHAAFNATGVIAGLLTLR